MLALAAECEPQRAIMRAYYMRYPPPPPIKQPPAVAPYDEVMAMELAQLHAGIGRRVLRYGGLTERQIAVVRAYVQAHRALTIIMMERETHLSDTTLKKYAGDLMVR